MPQRELLLVGELMDAAEQAQLLVSGQSIQAIETDRVLRDALLWNFTVFGEASSSTSDLVTDHRWSCGPSLAAPPYEEY